MRNANIHTIGICTLIFAMIASFGCDDTAAPAEQKLDVDRSEEMQAKRKEMIQRLIREGVFTKVEPSGETRVYVWITPKFHTLDYDAKQTFASLIYAFAFDDRNGTVHFRDNRTGKTVGKYEFGWSGSPQLTMQ